MGLSSEAGKEMAMPYVVRRGQINLRSSGKIGTGTFEGTLEQWLKNTPESAQKDLLGPKGCGPEGWDHTV
jgi:hypothetical protein